MSDALAVFHGDFGRVCLHALDRRMVPDGHRKGHLVFHVQGPPAEFVVDDVAYPVSPGQAVAVSTRQRHTCVPEVPGSSPDLFMKVW